MLNRTATLPLVFAFASMTGCSSNKLSGDNNMAMPDMAQAPADMAVGPDLSFPDRDPSEHPQLPQVDNFGGEVLANPEVWTIVWPGEEDLGAKVNQFMGWMLQSDYFTMSLSEYGVGAGKAKGVIVMPTAAPPTIDDSDFKNIVKSVVSMLPEAPNNNTILSFIIPQKTNSTMQSGSGCNDYGGYHSQTRAQTGGSLSISYAVNLQCPDPTFTNSFDALTDVMSHEIAESSTDPLPYSSPGWSNQTVAVGGEIGDLCVYLDTKQNATFNEGDAGTTEQTYVVQRLYSQKIAAKGNADPCIPAPSTPYFNAAMDPSDVSIKLDATTGKGDSMFKLEPYAYGAVGDIQWSLYGLQGSGITATPSMGTAKAGQTIRVTLHADSSAKGSYAPIFLEAQTNDGTQNEWFGSVQVQ